MWGDGWQKGGCMVVGQEGNDVLMYYLQVGYVTTF